jgi:HlyD family secretion protein
MNAEQLGRLKMPPEPKRRNSGPLLTIFLVVLLGATVAAYFAWPRESDQNRPAQGGATLRTATTAASSAPSSRPDSAKPPDQAPAAAGSLLTVSGYIINRERISLSPRFLGIVKWIGVKKGDTVTNGQVVVILDDAEQRAKLAQASGQLTNAVVSLDKARLDLSRISALRKAAVESQQSADDARLRLEAAQASLAEVRGNYELAATYLDWTVIRSPINGVVLEKLVSPGELVVPQSFGGTGPSTALISLADPKDLQVEIDIGESDLSKVRLNQRCQVSPEAFPDKVYEGYVAEMAPEANRQKGTLQLKVQIRNPDAFLTPQLSAKVDFLGKTGRPGQTTL